MKTIYAIKYHLFKVLAAISGIVLFNISGIAQTIELVKDINPSGNSQISGMIDLNGLLIFSAYETVNGSELWKSDGTDTGTVLIKDINPGIANSNVMNMVYYNGKIYFSADDGTNGREIWVTDGTANGTFMLRDINPTGNGTFSNAIVFNNLLFFNSDDGIHGKEWWTTDGTLNGTQIFVDSSIVDGNPEKPYINNNNLYFAYNNGVHGTEPWVTDGTPAGTHMVLNINPSNLQGSFPDGFTAYNGMIFFFADNGSAGSELWVTNGTSVGTLLLKDIRPGAIGSNPRQLTPFNNLLFFVANDGINGTELWATNGTNAVTYMVKDINTAGNSDIIGFTVINNKLFFSAIDNSYGREPWLSDGSATGTAMLRDINPGGNSMPGYFSIPGIAQNLFDGKLFFVADEGTNGYECWLTDGTLTGTQLIEPVGASGVAPLSNINQFEISGNTMYFDANYDGSGENLYRVLNGSSGFLDFNNGLWKATIHPNPSCGNFKIELTSLKKSEATIEIINVPGEKVLEKTVSMQVGKNYFSFNENNIEAGIYFLRIYNNEYQLTQKIIIQ